MPATPAAIPADADRAALPAAGADRAVPAAGTDGALPTADADNALPAAGADRVVLAHVAFHPYTEAELVAAVVADSAAGRGGTVVTPNVDILRLASRDAEAREHVEAASYVVADGTPLVWASRLAGAALPERVAGSNLIWSLSAALAARTGSVYLLGGPPGVADRAGAALARRYPGLVVAGTASPSYGFLDDPAELAAVCAAVVDARPDVVFVGLGFPKQERLIARLTPVLPGSWFVGCGAAIGFVAGAQRRAPAWMQRTGLEWLHRLASEPSRLARRYLVHDLPFATRLLLAAAAHGLARTRHRPAGRTDGPVGGGAGGQAFEVNTGR